MSSFHTFPVPPMPRMDSAFEVPEYKFRIIYVENCSKFSSQKPLFTGHYAYLDDIKERVEYFILPHPTVKVEYYTHKLGLKNRRMLCNELPQDVESIYVYLRSTKPMRCDICDTRK